MCGICGFSGAKIGESSDILEKMVSTLNHRGPDDKGTDILQFNNIHVALGHTRLAILDLSSAGHQPMHFQNFSIVLNGEIYNFLEIRKELELLGHEFNSESDTEVVLHAFAEWGASCLSKFIGMFAFAILNKSTQKLILVRDRAGVKPLYYYLNDGLFMFASELKAFHKHPQFEKKINANSVSQYMDYGFIPSPYCIFDKCHKLEPGHFLMYDISNNNVQKKKYWDVNDYYRLPKNNILYSEAKTNVTDLLKSSFEYRLVSDVPVGLFLSGGYDSTAVAAILQKNRTEKLNTFTIGFEEGNNEAPYAKKIAEYLGTNHTEQYCTTKEAQNIIPELPHYYDEPFADSSAIPTMLVSKLAVKDVTVALSADAGDEIFAGYNLYDTFLNNLKFINKIPLSSRKLVSRLLKMSSYLPLSIKNEHKANVVSNILSKRQRDIPINLYKSYWEISENLKSSLLIRPYENQIQDYKNGDFSFEDELSIALAFDYKYYLQNDILTKVDRATMSVALEGRDPFLDHRIIEYVAQLPMEYKYNGTKKKILKDIVHDLIPENLMDRPKSGFSIPIYSWLKKDLKYLLEENLSESMIKKSGTFNYQYVSKLKESFYNDSLSDPTIIWKIIQFQCWYRKWA